MFLYTLLLASDATSAAPKQPDMWAQLLPFVLIFVVFYFLFIRPQQKKANEHRQLVESLKKGSNVVTSGGIYGVVIKADDESVSLEVGKDTVIKVRKDCVAEIMANDAPKAVVAKSDSKDKEKSAGKKTKSTTKAKPKAKSKKS